MSLTIEFNLPYGNEIENDDIFFEYGAELEKILSFRFLSSKSLKESLLKFINSAPLLNSIINQYNKT